jgi:hypothetical protein
MTFHLTRRPAVLCLAVLIAGALLAVRPVPAHETDNFTMPVGRQFADLGPYFTRIVHGAVVAAVAETNRAIDDALATGATPQELAPLQSPEFIAGKVWEHIFSAIPTNELLDATLISEPVLQQYPGLVTMYRPPVAVYDDPLLVADLTKAVRTFFRAGTVSANGVEFGTDKLIHFINVGRIYHAKYEARVQKGMSDADAAQAAINSTARNVLTSENGMLGIWTTGIHSNGDLAADYAGMLFYRNLTRAVTIGPRTLPPILVREGARWRVQAEAESDFFVAFITPHWNEVLNPNRYIGYYSPRLRTLVAARCYDLVNWYRDAHGDRRGPAQFNAVARELSTYYGVPYGHESNARTAVTVNGVCFAADDSVAVAPRDARRQTVALVAGAPAADALGRTPLWWAAREGDAAAVRRLAATGDVDAADDDGETPLHAAVRAGSATAVAALVAAGARVDAPALYGVTPLMLATSRSDAAVVDALLAAGADANARDIFGQGALHTAALRGSVRVTAALVRHGADPRLADEAGRTPLDIAQQRAESRVVAALAAPRTATASSSAALGGAR